MFELSLEKEITTAGEETSLYHEMGLNQQIFGSSCDDVRESPRFRDFYWSRHVDSKLATIGRANSHLICEGHVSQ